VYIQQLHYHFISSEASNIGGRFIEFSSMAQACSNSMLNNYNDDFQNELIKTCTALVANHLVLNKQSPLTSYNEVKVTRFTRPTIDNKEPEESFAK
jgi:tyrosine-protein phosphatase YwqE